MKKMIQNRENAYREYAKYRTNGLTPPEWVLEFKTKGWDKSFVTSKPRSTKPSTPRILRKYVRKTGVKYFGVKTGDKYHFQSFNVSGEKTEILMSVKDMELALEIAGVLTPLLHIA